MESAEDGTQKAARVKPRSCPGRWARLPQPVAQQAVHWHLLVRSASKVSGRRRMTEVSRPFPRLTSMAFRDGRCLKSKCRIPPTRPALTPTTPQQLKIPAAASVENHDCRATTQAGGTVFWDSGNGSATAAGRFPSDGANGAGPGGRRPGPNHHPILTADSCVNAVHQSGVRVPPRSLAARHPWVLIVLHRIIRSSPAPGLCQTRDQYAQIQNAGLDLRWSRPIFLRKSPKPDAFAGMPRLLTVRRVTWVSLSYENSSFTGLGLGNGDRHGGAGADSAH